MDGLCRYCGMQIAPKRGPRGKVCHGEGCRKRYQVAIVNFNREHKRKPQLHCRYCGGATTTNGNRESFLCGSIECKRRYMRAYHSFKRRVEWRPDPIIGCVICSSHFRSDLSHGAYQKTCSEKCRRKLAWQRDKRRFARNPEQKARKSRYIAEWSKKNRHRYPPKPYLPKPPISVTCIECGCEFSGRKGRKLCSDLCRDAYNKKRYYALRPMRPCKDCGGPLKRWEHSWCTKCAPAHRLVAKARAQRLARQKHRAQLKVTLQAAFELGLIPSAGMRRRKADVTYKALRELGLVTKEKS